ncbi:hypothetical protein DW656_00380 [Coprococcus comes]|uniref:Uncharacterized protein n=1 Tax=Coprococcus comes TaxID=410072 RepID=A0A3R6DA20_9FIRM|nr:hypothetical protein DW656_00380 [Coprococcus comes]
MGFPVIRPGSLFPCEKLFLQKDYTLFVTDTVNGNDCTVLWTKNFWLIFRIGNSIMTVINPKK